MAATNRQSGAMLALAALTALAATCALAIQCERPVSSERCSLIRVRCLKIDRRQCEARKGVFIPQGGQCGYCDVCAQFVGAGQPCNNTVNYNAGGVQVEKLCKPPLVCSKRANGICTEDCQYDA